MPFIFSQLKQFYDLGLDGYFTDFPLTVRSVKPVYQVKSFGVGSGVRKSRYSDQIIPVLWYFSFDLTVQNKCRANSVFLNLGILVGYGSSYLDGYWSGLSEQFYPTWKKTQRVPIKKYISGYSGSIISLNSEFSGMCILFWSGLNQLVK